MVDIVPWVTLAVLKAFKIQKLHTIPYTTRTRATRACSLHARALGVGSHGMHFAHCLNIVYIFSREQLTKMMAQIEDNMNEVKHKLSAKEEQLGADQVCCV